MKKLVSVASALAALAPVSVSAQAATPRLCGDKVATIVGTPGDDVIYGTKGKDVIVALGGDERSTAASATTKSALVQAMT